ncbi:hypothetical protein GOBAR_AA08332 [Gossypium barbadense]|uniref:ABC transporter domain-containing protein n=1 Tax=Gossypium barbadense TaxID=3634 RepID=A0A2P5Y9R7_GOSBA|nr:hypothetical protein GOBAR_AA08332 [Gossypium barbadense]
MQGADIYRASGSLRRSPSAWINNDLEVFSRSSREEDDEEALKWAALEKLPTVSRLRKGILTSSEGGASEINIHDLGWVERKALLERLVKVAEEDNEKFLLKLKNRVARVGIDFPTVEVRFEHLNIEAEAFVGTNALPTILNFITSLFEGFLIDMGILSSRKKKLTILNDVSGIIKPSRLTLLLGPPSSGKTTLLLALAGKLDPALKCSGKVTYNGHGLDEFVPQRTAAYISQHDLHNGEMTVRETLAFSARCQGVGDRYELLAELSRREKQANIKPDPDMDVYMKVLGLEVCADIMVGDEMLRGISGGQRKRVTTGEMLVGPAKIVYQGPREHVLSFFESMGFKCPERKGVADFLQEVTSRKDQQQYWVHKDQPYRFVTANEFSEAFQSFHVGKELRDELGVPYEKTKSHPAALTTKKYGVGRKELLKACISREYLLMKRNSFVYIFKFIQLTIMAFITMTLFLRTEMRNDSIEGGGIYMGALFFGLIAIMFNGMSEISMTIAKLPNSLWVFLTYYVIGFDPNVERLFRQYLILVLVTQMSSGLFRFIAAAGRNMVVANTFGAFALLILFALGGFVLITRGYKEMVDMGLLDFPYDTLPGSNEPLGISILKSRGFFQDPRWYWFGVGGLLGFIVLFNFFYTMALAYLKPFEKIQALISEELEEKEKAESSSEVQDDTKTSISSKSSSMDEVTTGNKKKGMVLPFEPHSITFDDIIYSVDMPQEIKEQGVNEDKLVLLKGVSGSFRPGVLTALMGVSGAGKTTLMDVLAGRKTSGYIEGNITVSGFPKKQETFARVSGYCEQNDIHSPHVTVYESLLYSAWLRLPKKVNAETRKMFIDEVMDLVELNPLKQAQVGLPGVNGLSTEQRKRLTIAVELVANPSIIFMDEPTSGLDARAAAIVMRTVRNTVDTGRTVVCTIHQPSIDIFEAFDELFLMKRGGQEIYVGPLGHHSKHLIDYFEGIQGVSKIKDSYNPATWMLEVSTTAQELALGVDFADTYKKSELYKRNKTLIKDLSKPAPGSKELYFPTQFSQPFLTQCAACLWKQRWSYWRNPAYTAVRLLFTTVIALMFGTLFWDLGTKTRKRQDLANAMGSMYAAVLFLGIQNAASVQPVVAVERTVFYREKAAGMYSAMPYAIAQVLIEIPYIFVQAVVYGLIVYVMIGFEWTAAKFLWYLFFMYFTLLYFTFYGMMAVAVTPNHHIAGIVSSAFYGIWNVFSGFVIPRPDVLENGQTVEQYLRNYLGFKHEFIGIVAVIIIAFTILFGAIFTVSIRLFNFQIR